ncbi:hypothetical protein GBAR_LOCUS22434, partial [Geodia barretti]
NRNVEVALESWRRKDASTYWKNGTLERSLAHSSMETSCRTVTGMSCIRSWPPGTVSPLVGGGRVKPHTQIINYVAVGVLQ